MLLESFKVRWVLCLYNDKLRRQKSDQGVMHICDTGINLVYLVFAGSMLTALVGPGYTSVGGQKRFKGDRTTDHGGARKGK